MSRSIYSTYPSRWSATCIIESGHLRRILLLGVVSLLVACGDSPPATPGSERSVSAPEDIAAQVVAEFLSLPASEVTLVSLEATDFGDASLGCPDPGMSYAQVITPGHRVVVEADGRRFDVRVAGQAGRICRKPAHRGAGDTSPDDPPNSQRR